MLVVVWLVLFTLLVLLADANTVRMGSKWLTKRLSPLIVSSVILTRCIEPSIAISAEVKPTTSTLLVKSMKSSDLSSTYSTKVKSIVLTRNDAQPTLKAFTDLSLPDRTLYLYDMVTKVSRDLNDLAIRVGRLDNKVTLIGVGAVIAFLTTLYRSDLMEQRMRLEAEKKADLRMDIMQKDINLKFSTSTFISFLAVAAPFIMMMLKKIVMVPRN